MDDFDKVCKHLIANDKRLRSAISAAVARLRCWFALRCLTGQEKGREGKAGQGRGGVMSEAPQKGGKLSAAGLPGRLDSCECRFKQRALAAPTRTLPSRTEALQGRIVARTGPRRHVTEPERYAYAYVLLASPTPSIAKVIACSETVPKRARN